MELKDTIELMTSSDHKERFKAEYYQLKIRYDKLSKLIQLWDNGQLEFTPTCDRHFYDEQLAVMRMYLNILKERAMKENVDL